MAAIGTKRTSACALHMSAFDPKRTWAPPPLLLNPIPVLNFGVANENKFGMSLVPVLIALAASVGCTANVCL